MNRSLHIFLSFTAHNNVWLLFLLPLLALPIIYTILLDELKRIVNCYVISVLLYATEIWRFSSQLKKTLETTEMAFNRKVLRRSGTESLMQGKIIIYLESERAHNEERLLWKFYTHKAYWRCEEIVQHLLKDWNDRRIPQTFFCCFLLFIFPTEFFSFLVLCLALISHMLLLQCTFQFRSQIFCQNTFHIYKDLYLPNFDINHI